MWWVRSLIGEAFTSWDLLPSKLCRARLGGLNSLIVGPPKPRSIKMAVLQAALSRTSWMNELWEWLENLSVSDEESLGRVWFPSLMFPVSLQGIKIRSEETSEAVLIIVSA